MIKSFCSAFLMYSKIPMPKVEWKEENRKYAFCFFPLIGAVIGALIILWFKICCALNINNLVFAAVTVCIPVLVTGGIHLDGFCDVNDALASGREKDKMLEIMSDPRVGSFAAIKLVLYFLLQFVFLAHPGSMLFVFGFIQSRSYSALAAVLFKSAKSESTLSYFSNPAHKVITVIFEILYIIATSVIMIVINPFTAVFPIASGIVVFLFYRVYSYKKFGGITGDTEGWFLQIFELVFLVVTEAVLWF